MTTETTQEARLRESPPEALRRIAAQDIGGNAPWLADELNRFADRLAAEMRGECQWDGAASQAPGPLVMSADEQPWTPEEIAGFRERFAAAMANPGPLTVLNLAPSERWQARAEAAEAKLDAVHEYCQTYRGDEGMTLACEDILAITGGEEDGGTPDTGTPSAADRAMVTRATGGGIRSGEVQSAFDDEEARDG